MKKKKKVLLWAVIILVLLTAAHRLWPRPFESIAGMAPDDVTWISCSLRESLCAPGQPFWNTYALETEDPALTEGLMEILRDSGYQSDLRNLWPGGPGGVSSGRHYDGRSVDIALWFNDREGLFSLYFQDRDNIFCDFGIAHPTSGSTFNRLAEYIKEKGALRPPSPGIMSGILLDGAIALRELMGVVL